jgi:hypothetical protein
MKKLLLASISAAALSMAPVMSGHGDARADNKFIKGLIGGVIAGAVISSIVRAGEYHCHEGIGCHSHGYAGPYHYHQFVSGPIIYYQQPVYQAPPVVVAPGVGYPALHYQWCGARYRSYDPGSNTYQPIGPYPRRQCISPYI